MYCYNEITRGNFQNLYTAISKVCQIDLSPYYLGPKNFIYTWW